MTMLQVDFELLAVLGPERVGFWSSSCFAGQQIETKI